MRRHLLQLRSVLLSSTAPPSWLPVAVEQSYLERSADQRACISNARCHTDLKSFSERAVCSFLYWNGIIEQKIQYFQIHSLASQIVRLHSCLVAVLSILRNAAVAVEEVLSMIICSFPDKFRIYEQWFFCWCFNSLQHQGVMNHT